MTRKPEDIQRLLGDLDSDDLGESLAAVAALRALVDDLEAAKVSQARAQRWTWQQIGTVLGVSRQAAHKKYAGPPHIAFRRARP